MGAWGLGLFENDSDADFVSDFSHEAGISIKDDESITAARARLDSGVLAMMVRKRWADATNPAKNDRGWGVQLSPDYQLVILGALAMEVGAKLPDGLRAFMKRTYPGLGLQRHGRMQLESACEEYQDGTPYDFHNPALQAKMNATPVNDNDKLYPGSMMLNLLMPGQTAEGQASMRQSMAQAGIGRRPGNTNTNATRGATATYGGNGMPAHPRARTAHSTAPRAHPERTCGNCGAVEGPATSNGRLLRCGRCKKAAYCGKECQKEHWKNGHKDVCQA